MTLRPDMLRKVAGLMERYPSAQDHSTMQFYGIELWCYDAYDEQNKPVPGSAATLMAEWSRTFRRDQDCIDKIVKKEGDDYTFWLTIAMDGYTVKVRAARATVCRKVDTDEMETVQEYDYSKAPVRTITRPKTVWECSPLITSE